MKEAWKEITPSRYLWEREALAFLRDGLPDHQPYRAWSNLEFLAEDGSIHEVDVLVLTPKGFFFGEVTLRAFERSVEHVIQQRTFWKARNGREHSKESQETRPTSMAAKSVADTEKLRIYPWARLDSKPSPMVFWRSSSPSWCWR